MRLKELRIQKGISQLKLALDLNTNQNTISRYETGEREPGIQELIKLAGYFGVSIDYLLEQTDNPKRNQPLPLGKTVGTDAYIRPQDDVVIVPYKFSL